MNVLSEEYTKKTADTWSTVKRCTNCGAELNVTFKDLKRSYSRMCAVEASCVCCGTTLRFEHNEVPHLINELVHESKG